MKTFQFKYYSRRHTLIIQVVVICMIETQSVQIFCLTFAFRVCHNAIYIQVRSNLSTCFIQLMETSGTDILNDSDVRAPVSPLHLAVSNVYHA